MHTRPNRSLEPENNDYENRDTSSTTSGIVRSHPRVYGLAFGVSYSDTLRGWARLRLLPNMASCVSGVPLAARSSVRSIDHTIRSVATVDRPAPSERTIVLGRRYCSAGAEHRRAVAAVVLTLEMLCFGLLLQRQLNCTRGQTIAHSLGTGRSTVSQPSERRERAVDRAGRKCGSVGAARRTRDSDRHLSLTLSLTPTRNARPETRGWLLKVPVIVFFGTYWS